MAFGEGGIIEKAQQAKNLTEQAVEDEQESLNSLMKEYANIMVEDGENETIPEKPEIEPDTTLAERPKLSDGMIPVKYVNGIGWVKTTENDPEWYNYAADKKQWANVVLEDSTFDTIGSEEVLNEDEPYSMLVWIPRYAYKITSMYHYGSENAGNIEIAFIDTNNQDRIGKKYSTEYPTVTAEGTAEGTMDDFVVHPAFTFGENELDGFWVGKYETSYRDDNSENIQIKPGMTSLLTELDPEGYELCLAMNNDANLYGLVSNDMIVDPHLIKNTEWGAIVYLSQSIYGKNSKIELNIEENILTGGGNGLSYRNNVTQSSTGNITGIYDMSGGYLENVSAYFYNEYTESSISPDLQELPARYKDVYLGYISPRNSGIYGDAMYETSDEDVILDIPGGSINGNTWYTTKQKSSLSSKVPFFMRGGGVVNFYEQQIQRENGIFGFMSESLDTGIFITPYAFEVAIRVVVPVI